MKKIFTILSLTCIVSLSSNAQCVGGVSNCNPDPTTPSATLKPTPANLACAVKGSVYNESISFKIPASVLFGATSPLFGFVPIYEKISIEYMNLSCSPCSRHGKGFCRFKNLKCLQDIDTLNIFNHILNLKTKN